MYPVQAYWTSLLVVVVVGLFLNSFRRFLPNHPCLKTYSDHLWPFDHDSIVWNLSRSFWSSHAQSSWLLISMFTEKAARSLFGSCPLLVVYHSDVSIKTLSDCLSLLTAPFQKRPASPARAPPPTWCATDLPSTDPARKTNSFAGWSKGFPIKTCFLVGHPIGQTQKLFCTLKWKQDFIKNYLFRTEHKMSITNVTLSVRYISIESWIISRTFT